MNPLTESARLEGILSGPLNAILEQHRVAILAHLGGASTGVADALMSEEKMRGMAGYCYELLPWPVRLAVKKPAFVDFVLTHRESILKKLTIC
ncbi:hypothetical protein H3H39_27340 [Duganella sp. LX47W]|uniref:Uncharacterized protein n=2 Tax=Rugamonas apoptosis TaxID=2758570 RepID=A0A7W2FFP4_9BURK|nr:hypothetical protein [Rugamonas apoptosis]